jgi:hypothetical protein
MAGRRSSHWALLGHLVGTGERSRSAEPRDEFPPSQIIVSHWCLPGRCVCRKPRSGNIGDDALFAPKVQRKSEQWCCWIGRRWIIFGSEEIAAIRALQRCRSTAKRRRRTLAEDRDSTKPELRIPNAAAQTRIVSVARIRLNSRKSVRSFKGIICGDISEFESYMPSHAVWSPLPAYQLGLEGIVSKRLGSRYISGRSPDWVKMKNSACRSREAGGRGRLGPMIDDNGSRRSYRADRASAFTNNEDVP